MREEGVRLSPLQTYYWLQQVWSLRRNKKKDFTNTSIIRGTKVTTEQRTRIKQGRAEGCSCSETEKAEGCFREKTDKPRLRWRQRASPQLSLLSVLSSSLLGGKRRSHFRYLAAEALCRFVGVCSLQGFCRESIKLISASWGDAEEDPDPEMNQSRDKTPR